MDYGIEQTIAQVRLGQSGNYELNLNVLKINLTFVSVHLKTTADIQQSNFELPLEIKTQSILPMHEQQQCKQYGQIQIERGIGQLLKEVYLLKHSKSEKSSTLPQRKTQQIDEDVVFILFLENLTSQGRSWYVVLKDLNIVWMSDTCCILTSFLL